MQAFDFMNGAESQPEAINKDNVSDPNPYTQYGFERNTKKSVQDEEIPGYTVYDRPLLAESISEIAANLRHVEDVGVLVTDQHVLVAFEHSAKDRYKMADQMRKTAQSVVPSYYDIYVSDDPTMIDDIERFKGQSPRDDDNMKALKQTIERMKSSPQGDLKSR